MTPPPSWICCQLGAREHYAVPRALHRLGRLGLMVTDTWTRPGSPLAHLPGGLLQRMAERSHPDLRSAEIRHLTPSLIRHELGWRLTRRAGWDLLMARNEWFQSGVVGVLPEYPGVRAIVFAHSYSALRIFRYARRRGWTTVLGQIDPGQEHFAIVRRLSEASPQYGPAPPGPPAHYFEQWREECALADHIVVNSDWSRQAVIRAGIDAAKLQVLPLAYEAPAPLASGPHAYPDHFSSERPLRLLFVGTVSVVKGVAQLLEAMTRLADAPVALTLVGERAMEIPEAWSGLPGVTFAGAVPRGEMARYYMESDALVFPSHSDGFGMAQVEAQASGLPIIASPFAGRVVEADVTGVLLSEVSGPAIEAVVRGLLSEPSRLARYSQHALAAGGTGLIQLGEALVKVIEA